MSNGHVGFQIGLVFRPIGTVRTLQPGLLPAFEFQVSIKRALVLVGLRTDGTTKMRIQ